MSYQPQSQYFLVIRQGPLPSQVFPLYKDITTIGRAVDNDVVIDDAEISRYHAHLLRQGEIWVLEDLGSDNGVVVNGYRITGPVILTPGSQIALGPYVLFSMEKGAAPIGAHTPLQDQAQPVISAKPGGRWPILAGLVGVVGLAILGVLVLVIGGVLAYYYWYLPPAQPTPPPEIVAPAGPLVTFLEPDSGLQVNLGSSFLAFVDTRDEQGVVRIDLWVDDQLVVQQNSPDPGGITPFNLVQSMTAVSPGVHSMFARAYNKQGAMGESPALYVTVLTTVAANPPDPGYSQYIVQPGDTLDNIAVLTNNPLPAIQAANPGLGPALHNGQIVAIPPHPPLPKPGAQPPGQQLGQLQPGQIPGLAGLFQGQMAGLLPIPGGQAVMNQPGQVEVMPNFFPGANAANPPNSPIKAPQKLVVKADGCLVSLTWDPQGTNGTDFAIYRRQQGSPSPELLKIVKAAAKFYQDKVPFADTYEYAVETISVLPGNVGQKIVPQKSARSGYVKVDVKVAPNCIEDPEDVFYLYFQPLRVEIKGAISSVSIRYNINESLARRIPKNQQQYEVSGNWHMQPEVLPMPASLYSNPATPVVLNIWGTRLDWFVNKPPIDLSPITKPHNLLELKNPKNSSIMYEAVGQDYSVFYWLWMGKKVWDPNLVQAGGANLAAPTLRVARTTSSSRVLQWDWSGEKFDIDGFILYRTYACPGHATEFRAPQALPVSPQEIEVKFKTEPVGCLYRYQVSAYGRQGESNRSNVVEGDTASAYSGAIVNFQDLKINAQLNAPIQARIALLVNENRRTTPPVWVKDSSYGLNAFEMNGAQPNNIFNVLLAENEFIQLGFIVSEITADGFERTASVCQGVSLMPPVRLWKSKTLSTTIRSADDVCEVTVGFEAQPDAAIKSGASVRPQADLSLSDKIAQLGEDVYVYINNNGPDALTNQYVSIDSTWICADAKSLNTIGVNKQFTFSPSPYLGQGDKGQWAKATSDTRKYMNTQYRHPCYANYLKPEGFFKNPPSGVPSDEWLEQNVRLVLKAWITLPENISDPNLGNNTVIGLPGPME